MISSPNLASVMDKLKKGRDAIPFKVQAALAPGRHLARMEMLARLTLESLAETKADREAIPIILSSLTPIRLPDGMMFSMASTPNVAKPDSGWKGSIEFTEDNIDRDAIERWVREMKIKTDRDRYKSGEQKSVTTISNAVIAAIMNKPDSWFGVDRPGHGALNPDGLAQYLGTAGAPSEKLQMMMRAVLSVWSEFMQESLPPLIKAKIRESF